MVEHADFEMLAAYWLGELPAAEAEKLEEHFFACSPCSRRLEWLAALAAGTRAALRAGAVGMIVTRPFVEAMKRAGMRLREYHLDPGGKVDCTITADDDAVVSRISAPLAGVTRLDVLRDIDGKQQMESSDVPFDPAAQELIFMLRPAMLRKMAAHAVRVQLVSVEDGGRRTLGEYTFNHSPS